MQKSVLERVLAAKRAKTAKGTRFLRSLVQRRGAYCGDGEKGGQVHATGKLDGACAGVDRVKMQGHVIGQTGSVIVKLHAFAWSGQEVNIRNNLDYACEDDNSSRAPALGATMPNVEAGLVDGIPSGQNISASQQEDGRTEGSSTALLQYIATQKNCPLMLRPSTARKGGMLGRMVRRIFRRWYANSAFMLVAVGFRCTRVLMTCLGMWKVFLRIKPRVSSAFSAVSQPSTETKPDIKTYAELVLHSLQSRAPLWLLRPTNRCSRTRRASGSMVCISGAFREAVHAISPWLDKHASHGVRQRCISFFIVA
jgi:hypothetical protein